MLRAERLAALRPRQRVSNLSPHCLVIQPHDVRCVNACSGVALRMPFRTPLEARHSAHHACCLCRLDGVHRSCGLCPQQSSPPTHPPTTPRPHTPPFPTLACPPTTSVGAPTHPCTHINRHTSPAGQLASFICARADPPSSLLRTHAPVAPLQCIRWCKQTALAT